MYRSTQNTTIRTNSTSTDNWDMPKQPCTVEKKTEAISASQVSFIVATLTASVESSSLRSARLQNTNSLQSLNPQETLEEGINDPELTRLHIELLNLKMNESASPILFLRCHLKKQMNWLKVKN